MVKDVGGEHLINARAPRGVVHTYELTKDGFGGGGGGTEREGALELRELIIIVDPGPAHTYIAQGQ